MNDLISRQAAIKALDERCESECEYSKKQRSIMCDACYLGSAKEVIEALPTIDAVPVVRCKDCEHNYSKKHNKHYNNEDIVCDYWETDGLNDDDFCSYVERSEDGN